MPKRPLEEHERREAQRARSNCTAGRRAGGGGDAELYSIAAALALRNGRWSHLPERKQASAAAQEFGITKVQAVRDWCERMS
jgi:hypothetical protein